MRNLNIHFTLSVQNGSNKIISSSEEKFGGIKNGDLIRIGNEDNIYTIVDRSNYTYIKRFNVINHKTISIDENIGIKLQTGDVLKLSYKEYELLMICDILDRGEGYVPETKLTVEGGEFIINVATGMTDPVLLRVKEIDKNGGIGTLEILEKGKYLSPPNNPCTVKSHLGLGAKFNLKYTECENLTVLERAIQSIIFKDNLTYINLNYALPFNLKEGSLSVEKSSLMLNSPYLGETRTNLEYQIFRDFTMNLKLPLMAKNTLSPDIIFNKAMHRIDGEISAIKKHLHLT